ncbi:LutB/LldF family L-lactate oxidation iron-sulfur protein [Poriferisphaera sp. WC338]|uniref:LutB/LldF family L-lactate oxidation iron-sulfur protein n=1 Tax=Poriferisphaera sp. WC338 TaxID=3425129 RepID=UPI003D81B1CE
MSDTPANQQLDQPKHDAHETLFPKLPYNMKPRADEAVKNIQLQQFVNSTTVLKDNSRKQTLEKTFGHKTTAVRDLAGKIKQHTLDHLDHYLEQFIENAEKTGIKVHFAKDAKQARDIGAAIAKSIDAKLCVKSKSMVTEEIQLLDALESVGCTTVETDLGEFIIQLDNDAPSHIVTPMIHKNRVSVAKAFERELGAEYTEDPETLTKIAREHLRSKYHQADLGISGGNFLVAETGSVVICTNEGNGRLSTSAPKTHIAFVGIEKLIPRQEHLAVMLKVLTRSSTGQPLTCYTHIMTGPKRPEELDGPEDMHIVLVDNGRTEVLKPENREMLRCIRCGACLNACPVYRKVGGHAYGSVYPGPIGALLTPVFKGLNNYPDLPNASSLCGACYEACPVRINIPRHLIRLREEMVKRNIAKKGERFLMRQWAKALRSPFKYKLSNTAQRFMLRLKGKASQSNNVYQNRKWLHKAPGPAKGWTSQKDLPSPTSKDFRNWWNSQNRK